MERQRYSQIVKRAFFLGMGMAIDVSGSAAFAMPAHPSEPLANDFAQVGNYLSFGLQQDAKSIATAESRQLKLDLSKA